jgi:membrane-associated phospholipid phosphatase
MSNASEPFWGWPGWKHLRFATLISIAGIVWFILVYGGCDAITAHRTTRIRIHLDSELRFPFVPDMVLIYMSLYLLFLVSPFILRGRREFLKLAVMLDVIILGGGIGFLLIPAQLAFTPQTNLGNFPGLFRFADRLNLTYNLVPSLHVAFSVACVAVYSVRSRALGKVVLWIWAVAISASTVFTHQHHLLDVLAGWVLALTVFNLFESQNESERLVQSAVIGMPDAEKTAADLGRT